MDVSRLIQKIPVFHDLSPYQLQLFLKVCKSRTYKAGETLCVVNQASNEMFIVVTGALTVSTDDGVELSHIGPGGTVGEMGLVTNTPRCATIVAVTNANVLVIGRGPFVGLLNDDVDIGMKIYRNLLLILVARLRDSNQYVARSARRAGPTGPDADKQLAASTL